ncbi:MAG: GMC oxidoreductase [Ktedonobacteraceae bacterium]
MSTMDFDAIIIGSGFGGSVMAYRLADAGQHVCLLERGKPYPPGSFPRSPYRMKTNFWDPSEGMYGLYNIWSFQGINSVISSGLGGGSLIYANVMLRKDEKWFVKEDIHNGGYEYWPITRAELDPYYDRAEKMLHVQRYPFDHAPYDKTSKTQAFRQAAHQLNMEWMLPNLAVTFSNDGENPIPGEPIREAFPNLHGRTRYTCRLCGECDAGCNYGSKNTVDYTYLSAASHTQNADIRTLCEVRSFEPIEGGYAVYYVQHNIANEGQKLATHDHDVLPIQTLTTTKLILSAGTFGSTFLMLKNRSTFPNVSNLLGTRFCGNGDLINFALKCSDNSSGKRIPRVIDAGYGPVITSAIRIPDEVDGGEGRGFYLQDAGYPEFVNWILQVFDAPSEIDEAVKVAARLIEAWTHHELENDLDGYLSQLFGDCTLSSGLLPILGMGRDIPDGRMEVLQGKLNLLWKRDKSGPYFNRLRESMIHISDILGATFLDDPLWNINRVITVHPLGGNPMGRDNSEGVVDAYGEVFNYPGLYIVDGSIMPGPVGANPSLTIAALAEHSAEHIITKQEKK